MGELLAIAGSSPSFSVYLLYVLQFVGACDNLFIGGEVSQNAIFWKFGLEHVLNGIIETTGVPFGPFVGECPGEYLEVCAVYRSGATINCDALWKFLKDRKFIFVHQCVL